MFHSCQLSNATTRDKPHPQLNYDTPTHEYHYNVMNITIIKFYEDDADAECGCKVWYVAFLHLASISSESFVSKQQVSQLNLSDIRLTIVEWSGLDLWSVWTAGSQGGSPPLPESATFQYAIYVAS